MPLARAPRKLQAVHLSPLAPAKYRLSQLRLSLPAQSLPLFPQTLTEKQKYFFINKSYEIIFHHLYRKKYFSAKYS